MADYAAVADFRTATLAEYCAGGGSALSLTTTEASDALLAATITRMSRRIDEWTNDVFGSASETVDLDGEGLLKPYPEFASGYYVNVTGSARVYLLKRCTSLTTVSTRDYAGTLTVQLGSAYRLHSSLDAAGAKRIGDYDWIDIIPGQTLTQVADGNGTRWPTGPKTVQVVANFGWLVTPSDIRRAVALLVWDHFKGLRGDLRRASRMSTAEQQVEFATTSPSGIPEVDALITEYTRPSGPGF